MTTPERPINLSALTGGRTPVEIARDLPPGVSIDEIVATAAKLGLTRRNTSSRREGAKAQPNPTRK